MDNQLPLSHQLQQEDNFNSYQLLRSFGESLMDRLAAWQGQYYP